MRNNYRCEIKPKPKQTDGREIGGKGGGDPRPIQPDLPFMDEKELVAIGAKNPVWTYRVNKKGCPYIIARLKYLSASRSVIAGDKHSMKRLRKKREEMLFGEMEPHLVSEVLDEVKRLEPKLYAPLLELAELLLIFEDITDCRQACIEGMVVIADLYPRFNRGLQSSIEAIVKPKDTSL